MSFGFDAGPPTLLGPDRVARAYCLDRADGDNLWPNAISVPLMENVARASKDDLNTMRSVSASICGTSRYAAGTLATHRSEAARSAANAYIRRETASRVPGCLACTDGQAVGWAAAMA